MSLALWEVLKGRGWLAGEGSGGVRGMCKRGRAYGAEWTTVAAVARRERMERSCMIFARGCGAKVTQHCTGGGSCQSRGR